MSMSPLSTWSPLIGAAVVLTLLFSVYLGNNWIRATTYIVESDRLPASFSGFRIVQISDLHNHHFGPYQPWLLRIVREAHPDLIGITGDLTKSGALRTEYSADLMRDLGAVAPVYLVAGNHENFRHGLAALLVRLESSGVKVLRGNSVVIHRGTESIAVAGLDDPEVFVSSGKPHTDAVPQWAEELGKLRQSMDPDCYKILLSHRPDLIHYYSKNGFDLVLSGHTHGGQVRFPLIGAIYAPHQGWFPRYAAGMFVEGMTVMIVSRGLGASLFPMRLFNRPEIVIAELRSAPPADGAGQ
jgi:uncharacterized protein